MIIAKFRSEKHPEAAIIGGVLIDLALVYASTILAIRMPVFYLTNVAGSLLLFVVFDRFLRHLSRNGDEKARLVVERVVASTGASPEQVEAYRTGTITAKDVGHITLVSVLWLAYSVWYLAFAVVLVIRRRFLRA